MPTRYRAALALTSVLLIAAPPATTAAPLHPPHRRTAGLRAAADPPPAAVLYSRRALRRARTILQLKLLELRAERLERVRKAIERHVPIDTLLQQPL